MRISDVIGSAGVAMLLAAFLLSLLKKVSQDSIAYTLMNTVGAALACYASWLIGYFPFVVLEGTWCVVGAVALGRRLWRPPAR